MPALSRRDPEKWSRLKAALLDMLEDAARHRATVTYADVAVHVFGGTVPARSRLIMDLLGEVDEEMERERGIVIASLVVRSDSGIPGAGYFTFIATRFGADVSDPVAAWRKQAERVWAAYSLSPADERGALTAIPHATDGADVGTGGCPSRADVGLRRRV